ncbi:hypothetical protein IMCC3317_06910 [Kordia antarctica]|uniref:Uncharacterized protein n=1 Tax=Kordia antarctica TaxID=1218801 RepID=A0A7L4ZFF8_9FLAO|nr:hypothetical protein [Kordia antarctica]QHI35345.1 hypothetical protein IMCC3317_06910 [Kordia antarctica]
MKKRSLKNLKLNKKAISSFGDTYEKVKGRGTVNQTCEANGTWGDRCMVCHEQ